MDIPSYDVSACNDSAEVLERVKSFLSLSKTVDIRVMTSLLTFFALVGVIGNSTVVMVCFRYPNGQSTQLFILTIALVDLFVCAAIIPYRITSYHMLLPEVVCKLFEGVTYLSVAYSILLLMFVALDRYQAVCRPLNYVRYSKKTAILIIGVAILSVLLSVPSFLISGHYVMERDAVTNATVHCYTGVCIEDGEDGRVTSEWGVMLYSAILGLAYCLLVVVMVVSYTKVFCTLYKRQIRPLTKPERSRPNIVLVSVTQTAAGIDSTRNGTESGEETCTRSKMRKTRGVNAAHRRIAYVLLLVTVAFLVAWIPFLLMKLHLVPNIVSIRLTFFISNMINPLIYSFTNKQFRSNVYKLFRQDKNAPAK